MKLPYILITPRYMDGFSAIIGVTVINKVTYTSININGYK